MAVSYSVNVELAGNFFRNQTLEKIMRSSSDILTGVAKWVQRFLKFASN